MRIKKDIHKGVFHNRQQKKDNKLNRNKNLSLEEVSKFQIKKSLKSTELL